EEILLLPDDEAEAALGPDEWPPPLDLHTAALGEGHGTRWQHDVGHDVAVRVAVGQLDPAAALQIRGLGIDELDRVVAGEDPAERDAAFFHGPRQHRWHHVGTRLAPQDGPRM